MQQRMRHNEHGYTVVYTDAEFRELLDLGWVPDGKVPAKPSSPARVGRKRRRVKLDD